MHGQHMRLRKWLLVAIGLISVGIGVLGIFVPLLPTTPFLLIGAACFARSSDRLHEWLVNHRWLGGYIRDYRERGAITRRAKVVVLLLLWVSIGYSVVTASPRWWLQVIALLIAVGVTVHVARLRTIERNEEVEPAAGPEGE